MAIDTTSPKTRRAILIGALGATAASVAATAVGRANPVSAADGDAVLVGNTYSATTKTEIDATGGVTAFHGKSDSGAGVFGSSSTGYGVDAFSHSGTGVQARSVSGVAVDGSSHAANRPAILGESNGLSTGVQGWSGTGVAPDPPLLTGVYGSTTSRHGVGVTGLNTQGVGVYGFSGPADVVYSYAIYGFAGGVKGRGVFARAAATAGSTFGVYGQSDSPRGTGVYGWATAGGGKTWGVRGQIESPGGVGAVVGYSHAPTGSAPGVLGTTSSSNGIAVMGTATSGRGGVFSGSRAQVRLMPSAAASHPSSGLKGDLFVDTSGRLWFCKGGTTWKQVSLV